MSLRNSMRPQIGIGNPIVAFWIEQNVLLPTLEQRYIEIKNFKQDNRVWRVNLFSRYIKHELFIPKTPWSAFLPHIVVVSGKRQNQITMSWIKHFFWLIFHIVHCYSLNHINCVFSYIFLFQVATVLHVYYVDSHKRMD